MRKNSAAINSVANLCARIWGIISTYIFIPLYLKYLGETTYGLVSFFATLQGALTLLGLGLSSTLRREFAVGDSSYEERKHKHLLLRSTENVYAFIAIVIMAICFLGSNFIATKWLNIETLDPDVVSTTISLMGISIGLQLVANLWFGCILGLGHQVFANICSVLWAAFKNIGALVISIACQNIILFYCWHILIDLVYMLVLRIYIKNQLQVSEKWRISDFSNLKTIWKYALGLFAISIIALVTKQFDKTLISAYLTLSELGAYNLATTLGSVANVIASAISIAALTELTRLCSLNRKQELMNSFSSYNGVVSISVIAMGCFIAAYSSNLILLWTSNEHYASLMTETAPMVVLAIMFIGLQEVPYSLALAQGNTKINNITGLISLPFIVVLTYLLIKNYGLVGAGIAYLTTMSIQTILYLYFVYRNFMFEKRWRLLIRDFLLPLIISLVVSFGSKHVIEGKITNNLVICIIAVLLGAVTLSVLLLIFGRSYIKTIIGRKNS